MTTETPHVVVETSGGVAALTLNRPQAFNALTIPVMTELIAALEDAAADPSVRLITLTGAGKAFCSGADLKAAFDPEAVTPPSGYADAPIIDVANQVTVAIQAAPQLVVALVNGPAVGVGSSFVLACDLALASDAAYLKTGFESIGLIPDGGGSALLTASLGRSRAMATAILGDTVSADEARAAGLFARVWAAEEFAAESAALVASLASGPSLAYAAAKKAINAQALTGLNRAFEIERQEQRRLIASADFAGAVEAFQAKQKPTFSGR